MPHAHHGCAGCLRATRLQIELEKKTGNKGCSYCGGLGHRVKDCPKLRAADKEAARNRKDYFGAGGFGAET